MRPVGIVVAGPDLDPVRRRVLHPQDDAQTVVHGLHVQPEEVEEAGGMDLVQGVQALLEIEGNAERDVEGPSDEALAVAFAALHPDLRDSGPRELARRGRRGREGRRGRGFEMSPDLQDRAQPRLVAGRDQGVEARVIVEAVLPDLRPDRHVGLFPDLGVHALGEEAAHLGSHPERVPVGGSLGRRAANVHRHHHPRPERARLPHRQVVDHPAVHQRPPLPVDGREGQGEGHARPHRPRQVPALEHHPLPVVERGGHRVERDLQLVEVAVHRVARRREDIDQEAVHPVLAQHARGKPELPEVEAEAGHRAMAVVAASHRHQAPVGPVAEDGLPVEGLHGLLELGGVPAGGVDRAQHRSDAGARDGVDGNALLFEGAQHPHVRDPTRAPAGEGEGQAGAGPWDVLRGGRRLGVRGHGGKQQGAEGGPAGGRPHPASLSGGRAWTTLYRFPLTIGGHRSRQVAG